MFKKLLGILISQKAPIGKTSEPDEIPIDFCEAENKTEIDVLGPANLIEAFMPLHVFLGKPVNVFLNEAYELGQMEELPIQRANALMILLMMEKLLPTGQTIGTVLVSDGVTSHALSPLKVTKEESYRLYYHDPWKDSSFLEEGKNLAEAKARKEPDGSFSINYGEYERVIVAYGFVEMKDA